MLKEAKDLNKWNVIPQSRIRNNTMKVAMFQIDLRFRQSLSVSQAGYLVGIDNVILRFIWKYKKPRITKTIFKKNKVGELILSNFKT